MVFKAILFAIENVVLPKLGESFLSKVADNALNNVNNIMDFQSTVTTLKDNLKSLSAKASDVEEQIKTVELSGKKKRKREVEEWLRQVKSIDAEWVTDTETEGLLRRLEDGGMAAQLNQQVQKLLEQSWNFGDLLLDVCGTGRVTLLTTEMVGEAFQEDLEKIWRLLEMGEVSSIALYGMGGVGKTTLAMHIHNLLVEQSPGGVFWVTVSQGINIRSLQDKIAHCVGVNLSDMDDIKIRAGKLCNALSKMNNPVLILDDVWETIDLSELGCAVSKEGCRLIITTRSKIVCDGINCEARIYVQKLDKDEAWKLFSETLGKGIKLSSQVEHIARSVANLCGGLPLGLIVVAGSMKGEKNIHTWRNALVVLKESLAGKDGMGEEEVFKVLKYSFDRLSMPYQSKNTNEFNAFQLCFLYFSLYPEDYMIRINELVGKLVSEGLVERGKSWREHVDQGHVIVDHLVKVCLLESCGKIFGEKCVKMHDLVRGMALKIGGEKYMVRAGEKSMEEIPMEREWTEQLEKVSLMSNKISRIEEGTSPNCPNLSTLLLQYNSNLQFIPDPFFSRMQGLRTLDLSHTGISELSNSISELKSLEALCLYNCCNLKHVPNLGKLKLLRELDLTRTVIQDVPEGVGELIKLKFLSLVGTRLKVFPRGLLLKLVSLQVLKLPPHVQVAKEEIQNLKQLEQFSGGVENVGDLNSFIRNRVHDRTIYIIQVGSIGGASSIPFENVDGNEVVLTGCNLKDEEVLGQDINQLTLRSCEGLSSCFFDDLPRLNNPTSLRRLEIESCGGIECILRSEPQLSFGFSTLENIGVVDLEEFEGLVEIGGGTSVVVFPLLRELRIVRCKEMRRLGLSHSKFPNLEILHISECSEIEKIFKDEPAGREKEEIGGASAAPPQPPLLFSSLKRIELNKCSKVRKLGISVLEVPNLEYLDITECSEIEEIFEDDQGTSSGVAPLPKLYRLHLEELPCLKSVCKTPIISNSIWWITIKKCPELMKKMPLHLDHPPQPSLRYLYVTEEWWESVEWDNPNLPNLLLPFLKLFNN